MKEFGACRFLLVFALRIVLPTNAAAQDDTLQDRITPYQKLFSIGTGIQHGFIFAHSAAVENTRGSRPTGVCTMLKKMPGLTAGHLWYATKTSARLSHIAMN